MNAAGLRSISSNMRIILLNNGGGSEFHFFMGKERIPTINSYICAEHKKNAEGWIKSLGYEYYSARTKEEFDAVIEKFGQKSDKPLFLEVYTDMENDAILTKLFYNQNKPKPSSSKYIKGTLKNVLPHNQITKIKKIIEIMKS